MQFLRWLSKEGGGRRDNTHSTHAVKFRKALCYLPEDQADRDSQEGAGSTASPEEPEAGVCLCLHIWEQGSDLEPSPGKVYTALVNDLLILPTPPQAIAPACPFVELVSNSFRCKSHFKTQIQKP